MEKTEYCTVIKYFFLKGISATQIKDELDTVYENLHHHLPSWNFGQLILNVVVQGRPKTETTDNNI